MDNILSNILAFSGASSKSKLSPHTLPDSTAKVVKQERKLGLICFSKKRPYQLYQFLTTHQLNVKQIEDNIVSVLYLPGQYELEYNHVFSRFPTVEKEFECCPFTEHLMNILISYHERGMTHVMFSVDDMIFTHAVNIM